VNESWRSERARFAALTRSRLADDPDLIAARQAFKAGVLAEHVRRVVNEPPALTSEQIAEIAKILSEHNPKGNHHDRRHTSRPRRPGLGRQAARTP
jgi:hypothetical protein